MRTPIFEKGIHVDGQMMGTKAGSRELFQDVVKGAMEPARCVLVCVSACRVDTCSVLLTTDHYRVLHMSI